MKDRNNGNFKLNPAAMKFQPIQQQSEHQIMVGNAVWNAYIAGYKCEPYNAYQLLDFSRSNPSLMMHIDYKLADATFKRNKGRGSISYTN